MIVAQLALTMNKQSLYLSYRWLDESDGENGIEQELILSDIMVADEEDQKEDLPGMENCLYP